jgi:hypothetical protein
MSPSELRVFWGSGIGCPVKIEGERFGYPLKLRGKVTVLCYFLK